MYRINTYNGDIHDASGLLSSVPYDDSNYQDYATWIAEGNVPEEFYEIVGEVPEKVSRFQALAALYQAGFLEQVNAMMASADLLQKLAFDNAMEFRRDSHMVLTMSQALNLTSKQVDDLFRLAATITA